MNTTLDWELWKPIFLSLAGEMTLVFLLAFATQRLMGSMSWRRTIWQIAFLSLSLLVLAETTGAQRWAWSWLRQTTTDADGTLLVESKILGEPNLPLLSAPGPQESGAAFTSARRSSAVPTVIGWPAVLWLTGTAAALSWIVAIRMAFLVRMRRRTVQDESLLARADAIARRLGMTGRVRLSEARELAGPIAFGVFRPGITLPEGFCRRFSAPQQEVMLAHELAHLSARDPFWHLLANLVTALLWWHPLVWFAKRELRAASEAAADEASLVVENGPATLAECLVELGGRLTRTRSLGWLGVEGDSFRSGLGKRVKRLVTLDNQSWNRPSRARLWLARCLASAQLVVLVLVGTAWARPESPAAETLRQAFQRSVLGIALTAAMPTPQEEIAPPTNIVEAVLAPPVPTKTNATTTATSAPAEDGRRKALNQKLDSILLEEISFDGEPLKVAVAKLARLVKSRDPEGKGINFIVSDEDAPQRIDPTTGLPGAVNADFKPTIIRLKTPLKGVTVREALNEMIRTASLPIIYQVEAYAVVFSPKDAERKALHTRSFKIDPATFERALIEGSKTSMDQAISDAISAPPVQIHSTGKVFSTPETSAQLLIRDARRYFVQAGVDFSMPGRRMIYSDGKGYLMVRATLEELDIVEQAIQILNMPLPQLTLEVKFCEVTAEDARALGFDWFLGGVFTQMSNSSVSQKTNFHGTGVLTEPQSRVVFQALEQRSGVNILHAPKMTTLSGRQAQMKTVQVRYIVTDLDWSFKITNVVAGTNESVQARPIAEQFELGPVLDVVPHVLADGYTIQMTLIPTLTEFLGYDLEKQNRRETVTMPDGRKEIVTVSDQPSPIFRKLQMVSTAIVKDGQTVVMAGGSEQFLANPKRNTPLPKGAKIPGDLKTTSLLIFVTPTLVDAAGNRIHKPEEIPPGVPAQPPASPKK